MDKEFILVLSKDKGGKFMDAFADKLGRVGAWCGQNKYLNAIKNAFQNFMPATISGAVGVLWTNVLVNETTGLGALWSPIMVLKVLNPIFTAMQYAQSHVLLLVLLCYLLLKLLKQMVKLVLPSCIRFILWMMVTPTSFAAKDLSASFIDKAGKSHGYTF